ncbi:DUF3509 domain-containing protein [Azotobacter bryophylli]|uniref:DUF3509 domain-containing protein n=1 Tax=Azotobacter bryophylli TaxID=1986537 RepID=A0ABV7APG2_9GAMM
MDSTSELLIEALAPYKVSMGTARPDGSRLLTLCDAKGDVMLERLVYRAELVDRRLLIDVVDGLHRDVRILEGRLDPRVIAALEHGQCTKQCASF